MHIYDEQLYTVYCISKYAYDRQQYRTEKGNIPDNYTVVKKETHIPIP